MTTAAWLVGIYLAGLAVGLLATDDRWPRRILLSLLWPVGPAAFVLVVSGLTLVAIGLWPLIMLPLVAGVGAIAYFLA